MSDEEKLVTDAYESLFVYTPLSIEVELQGQLLNPQQKLVIQNERAKIAEQKVRSNFDPNNIQQYAQTEALLKGQIQMLDWLLSIDKIAREIISNSLSTEQ